MKVLTQSRSQKAKLQETKSRGRVQLAEISEEALRQITGGHCWEGIPMESYFHYGYADIQN